MIQFENVTKTFAGGKVKAVDGLDMKIEEGKVFGFIGPNGAGKTTTIKLLTGILSPDSGRVMLNGIDMARDPIAAKRSFGYVPDAFDMYERLTGMDYLNFMADIYGVDAVSRLFRSCLHAIKVICRLPFKALPHLKALRTEIKFLSAKVAHITANAMISAPLS